MRLFKSFLSLSLASFLFLTGCGSHESQDSGQKDNNVSISGFSLTDNSFSSKVDYETTSFSFINKVTVPSNCTWSLFKDFDGKEEIKTKTIMCEIGHNNIYMLVENQTDPIGFFSIDVYRLNMFTVSFNTSGGSFIEKQQVQEESCAIRPDNPTKPGYTFTDWDYDFNLPVLNNLTINALWSAKSYNLILDPDGGNIDTTQITVTSGAQYKMPVPGRDGYTFDGWYYNNNKIPNNGTWNYIDITTLTAKWTIINYSIKYVLFSSGTNNPNNPSSYTIEDEVVLLDAEVTEQGYHFNYWEDADGNKVEKISKGTTGNLSFYANYGPNQYELNISSNNSQCGSVSILAGEGYTDETIVVKADAKNNCLFKGWFDESDIKIADKVEFSFVMPAHKITLWAKFVTQEEQDTWDKEHGVIPTVSQDNKTITYGMYPQTHVSDNSLIDLLNSINAPNEYNYYLFEDELYTKVVSAPYSNDYSFIDGEQIKTDITYWFKVEPIQWEVISHVEGHYELFSEMLLDVTQYYHSRETSGDVAPSVYNSSNLRRWLNNDFFETAFHYNSEKIIESFVDNSSSTTQYPDDNPYTCDDVYDKVFAPSYLELKSLPSWECAVTDYSKAKGANVRPKTDGHNQYTDNDNIGMYWTRSPRSYAGMTIGSTKNYAWGGYQYVDCTYACARPCITVSL